MGKGKVKKSNLERERTSGYDKKSSLKKYFFQSVLEKMKYMKLHITFFRFLTENRIVQVKLKVNKNTVRESDE